MRVLFLLLASFYAQADELTCRWVCESQKFPKFCQLSCNDSCPTTECDERSCTCNSFETNISDCTPPNIQPNACHISQVGINCRNMENKKCGCEVACQKECQWDCQIPATYQEPKCTRYCEEPSCILQDP